MTPTPATLIATADRYERHYGCRKGDGGTADQLRAGAAAMLECERIRAEIDALTRVVPQDEYTRHLGRELASSLQGDPK
jgi:hypothetical protein